MSELPRAVQRERTAIRRVSPSRPIRVAVADGVVSIDTSVFDYGCGHGADLRYLESMGIACSGWDPVFAANADRVEADVVNLGYVVNVIEDPHERVEVLRQAWALARRLLIVAARLSLEADLPSRPNWFSDGFLTARGTFQKLFEQQELREWLEESLGEAGIAAAPGIFYVFKDASARESFSASRFVRSYPSQIASRYQTLYEQHQQDFTSLAEFLSERGRLPRPEECAAAAALEAELGSIRRAVLVLNKIKGAAAWEQARDRKANDLLVYLALSRFPKRCKFSELPNETQLDVRAFFGTYSCACEQADALLFSAGKQAVIDEACRSASVGKLTTDALYLHDTALHEMPAVLRVYEGCARVLVGRVQGANVIKLRRDKPKVSYLYYPGFESIAHPSLMGSLRVDLRRLRVNYLDYGSSDNRPILHRKEQFVSPAHESHTKFMRLTKQEEDHGLFDRSELIGYEQHWNELLRSRGLRITGHRLIRQRGGGVETR